MHNDILLTPTLRDNFAAASKKSHDDSGRNLEEGRLNRPIINT